MSDSADVKAEAAAFNQRITEREQAGFIRHLRRAVKCDYFTELLARSSLHRLVPLRACPHFSRIAAKTRAARHPDSRRGLRGRLRVAGVGARRLRVTAIDIADKAIQSAMKTLASNPYRDGFDLSNTT